MDAKLIPEQVGFQEGKSCTSQLLNMTEHIEDGYEKPMITGAVFVDLAAAYDTVNHRRLLSKVLEMTGDVHLTDLIRTMLESRRIFVVLDEKNSGWRRLVHRVARKRLQQHRSFTHVCPMHYDHLLRHEQTAFEPFTDTQLGVCIPHKELRRQTRTECSVGRYQTLKHNNISQCI